MVCRHGNHYHRSTGIQCGSVRESRARAGSSPTHRVEGIGIGFLPPLWDPRAALQGGGQRRRSRPTRVGSPVWPAHGRGRMSEQPGRWWVDQLNNHEAIDGYTAMGEEIWCQTDGQVDAFVDAVGTAHSIHGAGDALRRHRSDLRIPAKISSSAARRRAIAWASVLGTISISSTLSGSGSHGGDDHGRLGVEVPEHGSLRASARVDRVAGVRPTAREASGRRLAGARRAGKEDLGHEPMRQGRTETDRQQQ